MKTACNNALKNDYHIHTYLSACCSDRNGMRPDKIINRTEKLGYECIGFSDHYWLDGFNSVLKLKKDLGELKKDTATKVLLGCEADLISENRTTITRKEITDLKLDFVILATNHFHLDVVEKPGSGSPRAAAEHWLKFLRAGILSGLADIIPHPILNLYNALGNMDAVMDTVKDEEIFEVLELAAAKHVAMDINPRLFTNPLWSADIQIRFYGLCKKAGVKIAPASDAHALDEIGDTLKLAPWIARIGLDDSDFINAAWLEVRKRKKYE
ncbi:MAG: PHP domain-containing protein [Victivallaceae bacterium]|nr:PHP domain-containing protein [Victivallaceae bacterium]